MKKAFIFSILILFLVHSLGYYFLFELNRHLAREEMQNAIQNQPARLTILKISDTGKDHDFRRIDRKEISYKGIMYDVVREIKSGPASVFICVHDARETSLFAGFKRVNQNKLHLALWDHLILICSPEPLHDLTSSFFGKITFPQIHINLKSTLLRTWSPPPEFS